MIELFKCQVCDNSSVICVTVVFLVEIHCQQASLRDCLLEEEEEKNQKFGILLVSYKLVSISSRTLIRTWAAGQLTLSLLRRLSVVDVVDVDYPRQSVRGQVNLLSILSHLGRM